MPSGRVPPLQQDHDGQVPLRPHGPANQVQTAANASRRRSLQEALHADEKLRQAQMQPGMLHRLRSHLHQDLLASPHLRPASLRQTVPPRLVQHLPPGLL
uniref:(northern house mosquito) hypothetical protein n=1 Tax=Culex pipiens TaxID=7175 RepID=A0A8D8NJU4_CULPI